MISESLRQWRPWHQRTRDTVTANTSATTTRTVTPFTARYLRLLITRPVADTVPAKTTRLRTLNLYPPT
jgi:hypothetical protein